MAILRLKRLPTDSDMSLLGSIGIHTFIDNFNLRAIDGMRTNVELLHEGLTICMGEIAWEHRSCSLYELEEAPEKDPVRSAKSIRTISGQLGIVRVERETHVTFRIESKPQHELLALQCYVKPHNADRLEQRIIELTEKGYFDEHPRSLDKLAQLCDVLVANDSLVKCRYKIDDLLRAYHNTAFERTMEVLEEFLPSDSELTDKLAELEPPASKTYLVEAFWFDPVENRNAYGWKPIGIVRGEDEKTRVEDLGGYKVADHPYPLKQAVEFEKCIPNDSTCVPCYRCVLVDDMTGMGSLLISDIKHHAFTTIEY